jgi:CubicO group peptidase (beta-lactamase class C family)
MRRIQVEDGDVKRGLGFLLWPDPKAASSAMPRYSFSLSFFLFFYCFGNFSSCLVQLKWFIYLTSYSIYGHTGFTGTAIWIDPERYVGDIIRIGSLGLFLGIL